MIPYNYNPRYRHHEDLISCNIPTQLVYSKDVKYKTCIETSIVDKLTLNGIRYCISVPMTRSVLAEVRPSVIELGILDKTFGYHEASCYRSISYIGEFKYSRAIDKDWRSLDCITRTIGRDVNGYASARELGELCGYNKDTKFVEAYCITDD